MAFEKDPDEIGALWVKHGTKGEYMTGTINGIKVVCFANTKGNENAPQWRVLKSKPRDGEPTRVDAVPSCAPPVDDSEIPF